MKKLGGPITRERYIWNNWPDGVEDWTAEHEAELPEELQDWSQFEKGHGRR